MMKMIKLKLKDDFKNTKHFQHKIILSKNVYAIQ